MTPEREKEKKDQIEQIVLTFIADDSPLQINLPDAMRNEILKGVSYPAMKGPICFADRKSCRRMRKIHRTAFSTKPRRRQKGFWSQTTSTSSFELAKRLCIRALARCETLICP